MQLPPTTLILEPLRGTAAVYDTPPVVVRRRRLRALVARIRRAPAPRPARVADEPVLLSGRH